MSIDGLTVLADQIDWLVNKITLAEYSTIEINCLLPVDCSKDVINLLKPFLRELKEQLLTGEAYDSFALGILLSEKFTA